MRSMISELTSGLKAFVPKTEISVLAVALVAGALLTGPLPGGAAPAWAQAATPATVAEPPVETPAAPAAAAPEVAAQAAGTAEAIPVSPAAPDPLTPPPAAEPPAVAPAVPKTAEAARPPIQTADPIVTEVRRILGGIAAPNGGASREDHAALAGFYTAGDGRAVWTSSNGLSPKGIALIAELKRAANYGLESAAFEVPPAPSGGASPEVLADHEVRIGLAALKYARHARGGRLDPAAVSALIDHNPRMYEPRSVIEALAASDEPNAYIKGLHPQHAGFQRLQKALVAARTGKAEVAAAAAESPPKGKGKGGQLQQPQAQAGASTSETVQRIIVNMERWRWMPDKMGAFYVWDNVPEQLTRVMHDGRAVLTEKIVVGKPGTQTPEFSAPMKFVIFHPSWGVPDGIKTNEVAPMLRRASANSSGWFGDNDAASRALRRHELVVMQNGRQVNPDSINWQSVDIRQFQFTQPPSAKNVLGIVKFRFPNRHDVYMHDTPERHLFGSSVRAFSHGCMRVQNPIHLAEVILAYDKGWSAEKVNSMSHSSAEVTLEKSVPVHVTYFTAAVDEDGKLKLFGDIYGKDARVASALSGRNVNLASASASAEPAGDARSASGKRDGKRAQRAKKPEPGFNPFSFLSN